MIGWRYSLMALGVAVALVCLICFSQVMTPNPVNAQAAAAGPGNILSMGCDPTGERDSAPCFQAALRACGAWYVPPGNYLWKTTVRVPSPKCGTRLWGVTDASTVTQTAPLGLVVGTPNNHSMQAFVLEDLTFRGQEKGGAQSFLQVFAVSNFRLSRLHILFFRGEAIRAEQVWDSELASSFIQYSGDGARKLCALNLAFNRATGADANNHWDIHGNLFEGNHYSDICASGVKNEDDHFISRNKFGGGYYKPSSADDPGQYHIVFQGGTVGTSIDDNWFFGGGMVYARDSTSLSIKGNHGRELQQGITLAGAATSTPVIYGNHIEGDNRASMTAGRAGIVVDGIFALVGPGNDTQKWNVSYRVQPTARAGRLLWPMDSGGPALRIENRSQDRSVTVLTVP